MNDDPENHTLRLLREMRDEQAAFRAEVTGRFDKLEAEVAGRFDKLELEVAAMRADQGRTGAQLEAIQETLQNQGARLNAMDGRLAIIEKRVGLVKA